MKGGDDLTYLATAYVRARVSKAKPAQLKSSARCACYMPASFLEQGYRILTGILDYICSGPCRLHGSQRGSGLQDFWQIREMYDCSTHCVQQVSRPCADEIFERGESHNHEPIAQQTGTVIVSCVSQHAINEERIAGGLLDCADPLDERFTRRQRHVHAPVDR
jgi:hypothetical protein